MPIVNIHVSKLTLRVLDALYGPHEPYQIRRSDQFYYLLCQEPLRQDDTVTTRFHRELTGGSVQLKVTENLAARLRANNRDFTIGWSLHKAMQFKMMDFVEAQALAGMQAQTALKMFFRRYNVEEDDYSLDTAYTAWKRHQEKFSGKSPVFSADSRRSFDPRRWLKKGGDPIPDDKSWILESVEAYYDCGLVNLICKDVMVGTFRHEYDTANERRFAEARKVAYYLLNTDGRLPYTKIASFIDRHQSSIRRGAQDVEFLIKTGDEALVTAVKAIRVAIAACRPK